jgi:hypothetical protein
MAHSERISDMLVMRWSDDGVFRTFNIYMECEKETILIAKGDNKETVLMDAACCLEGHAMECRKLVTQTEEEE